MTPTLPSISMRIVYEDEHLIEVETSPSVAGWAARSTAYASAQDMIESTHRLREWVSQPAEPFMLVIGADTGIGWACLRFYAIDKSGHIACHLRLASMSRGARDEETWRFSIEMRTEPALIDRFATAVEAMVVSRRGEALLRGVMD